MPGILMPGILPAIHRLPDVLDPVLLARGSVLIMQQHRRSGLTERAVLLCFALSLYRFIALSLYRYTWMNWGRTTGRDRVIR